jgi:alpha-mannosidase
LEIVNFDGPKNIILSTVKRAEDDVDISTGELPAKRVTKSIVVRLYDSLGGKSKGYITTSLTLQKVVACNLLEDDLAEVEFETMRNGGARIPVNIRAFEIASFRLELS